MTFAGALGVLDTHLTAAGAAVSPTITNIAQGERASGQRRIDYWFVSVGDPSRMSNGETLSDRMLGVEVMVRVYVPVADRRESLNASIEADLYAISVDIVSRVMGDFTLGGECAALRWDGIETGWQDSNGAWLRISDVTFTLDFVEQITIAP